MNLKTSHIILLCWLSFSCKQPQEKAVENDVSYSSVLMEPEEFMALNSRDNYTVIDFRPKSAYEKGHLPEAINIWRPHIENTTFSYKGMLPTKSQLEQLFSQKGIEVTDTLLVYDNRGSCDATRLWWVLDHYGFTQTKILNGGLQSFKLLDEPLSTTVTKTQGSCFFLETPKSKHHIEMIELQKLLESGDPFILLDCRTEEEYSGLRQKKGSLKAGRIPNSILMSWGQSVDMEDTHKFLPIEKLQTIYGSKLPDKEATIVAYCHTGVRSSHTTFVLTQLLGYSNVKNYDGSWVEWSHHDLPYEKDVETMIFE